MPRKKKPYFAGMEPPSIEEIDEAAGRYVEARDARMTQQKDEVELHDALLGLMHKNGLTEYDYEGYKVLLLNTEKVRVRRQKEPSENGEE